MSANSAYIVKYPSSVTVPSSLTTCTVSINGVSYTATTCLVDAST